LMLLQINFYTLRPLLVQPKLPLLKILQAAGAQGETFTMKEVMRYLGQYIMVRQLYDKRQQHMVYCGGDPLGELLGLESFSVKEPSPVHDMLKRNLTSVTITDAAQTLALAKDQSVESPSQDQLKVSASCFHTERQTQAHLHVCEHSPWCSAWQEPIRVGCWETNKNPIVESNLPKSQFYVQRWREP
uniref:DM2 domain-containing protein n=1 Tax=Chelydra serpentina TaxID=8475 RepID=A0A8C3XQK0_CHESE